MAKALQISPAEYTARVKCVCGWWISVQGAGVEEPCWKCNGKVKFFLSGQTPIGKTMPFMQWTWEDTKAQPAN